MFTSPEGETLIDLLEEYRVAAKAIFISNNSGVPEILIFKHQNGLSILPGGHVEWIDYDDLVDHIGIELPVLNQALQYGLERELREEMGRGINDDQEIFQYQNDMKPSFVVPWVYERKGRKSFVSDDKKNFKFALDYVYVLPWTAQDNLVTINSRDEIIEYEWVPLENIKEWFPQMPPNTIDALTKFKGYISETNY